VVGEAGPVLITGANGLVGRRLQLVLRQAGRVVIPCVRKAAGTGEYAVGDIDGQTVWAVPLTAVPVAVVHLAAHVHQMREDPMVAERLHRQVNTEGTLNLARLCAAAGVRRFVFVSTVKVLGEGGETPYRADAPLAPIGPYSVSKAEAEAGLWEIAAATGMEVVVVRPPLVYGPGVGANFLRLMQVVARGWPMPLGAVRNGRSLVYLDNLIDVIRVCLSHPAAAGRTYLVSDGDDVSTPDLARRIGAALGRPARLIAIPTPWMQWAGCLLGKQAALERLLGSLRVNIDPLRQELGWTPPYTMQAGLAATAAWYRDSHGNGRASV